ncbi:MAG: DUF1385 domain-containing protein [Peptococcaceae bacterium]|nr:DUF1385 domain-containing protein [Peptococcaceae bacterium]
MADKTVGGQAIMEGVMMRGPKGLCMAVRKPDGTISICKKRPATLSSRWKILKWPVLRGTAAFVDTLVIGLDALMYSANESGDEDMQLSKGTLGLTMFAGLAIAVGLFMILPTVLIRLLGVVNVAPIVKNLLEGAVRLTIFLIYIVAISAMPDMRRLYQYHGAEHKAIFSYEADQELLVENVRSNSCLHPRCGTAFLLIVMITSILVFSLFGWPNMVVRILTRLLLLPIVAGIAYEVIKAAARGKSPLWGIIIWPGLLLQTATTREPDDGQIEVAIAALKGVRELEDEAEELGLRNRHH